MEKKCSYNIADLAVGMEHKKTLFIKNDDVVKFIQLIKDFSPLHSDEQFAKKRGFEGKVVPGIYLGSLISAYIGSEFPGENSLCMGIDFDFIKPVYADCQLNLEAVVDQISEGVKACIIKIKMSTKQGIVLRANVRVKFTN